MDAQKTKNGGGNAMSRTITIAVGQAFPWRASPSGVAQVEYLHRTRVTLIYRAGRRIRRMRVSVKRLVDEPLLFTHGNPFNRGVVPRSKTFEV